MYGIENVLWTCAMYGIENVLWTCARYGIEKSGVGRLTMPPSVYTLLAIETADCCADCGADLTGDLSPAAVLWLQPMISAAIERRDRPACVVTCGRLLPTLSAELHSPAEERCERRRVGTT